MNMEFIPELQAKLELLESKLGTFLAQMKELKRDNARLKSELADANQELAAGRVEKEQIDQAMAEAQRWKTEVQDLRTSRDQAARKIELLLNQLDDLTQDLSQG